MRATPPTVTRRVSTASDEGFLRAVHATTREDLACLAWDATTRDAVLRLQFDAQTLAWRADHPGVSTEVVLVDEVPVGRLVLGRSEALLEVVDIAVLPEHRGRGIGTVLLTEVLAEADARRRPVRLCVDRENAAARRLYERLGFVPVGSDAFRVAMSRDPVS